MNPVLMLVRNCLELNIRAVESVLMQYIPVDLYVIDNESTDGTMEWLENLRPVVRSWRFTPAQGVSRSWNFGLDYLFNTAGCEHVLVVNNDVELRPDTYRWLLKDGGPFVTGVSVDKKKDIEGEWSIPHSAASRRPHPDFSCFLIRREVWERIGRFDESMMLYVQDLDYHLRLHGAGIPAYTIGIPFYHERSGTLRHAPEVERRAIEMRADQDRLAFEKKWNLKVGSDAFYAKFKETLSL